MSNQNQNPQNEQSTDSAAHKEHGFFTKAKALFAGSILVAGSAVGVGVANAHGNNAPDSHLGPASPTPTEVVINDNNMTIEPGTVLTHKPKVEEAPKTLEAVPAQATQAPALVHHDKPEQHNSPAGEVVIDDSGMAPTDAPSPGGEVVVDDSGMAPTPAPEGEVVVDDSGMLPTPAPGGEVVVDDSNMVIPKS